MTALANDFKTLTWIANKGLAYLLTNMPFVQCGSTQYMPEFDNREYAKGDSIQIRRSNRRVGGEGATINLDGVVEKTETLTIEKQFNDGLVFTTKEQALFQTGEYGRDIYAERYIYPSINRLVHQVNSYIGARAATDLNLYYGAAATPLTTTSQLAAIRSYMEDMSMPVHEENYLICTPNDGAQIKNALVNFFNPTFNKGIGERFFAKQVMDFQLETTNGIYRHTAGGAAALGASTIQVKTSVASGATSVVLKGLTANQTAFIKKGDVFTVNGSYLISPSTLGTTSHLVQAVVTADANTSAGGEATVYFTVNGDALITDTSNPFINASAVFTANEYVSFLATHNVNIAMVKGGLDYAAPKMQKMWTPYCVDVTDDKFGTGISLRLSRGADIVNDQNIMRWDLLFGAKFHPELCIRVAS